jgi:hypothetical protein
MKVVYPLVALFFWTWNVEAQFGQWGRFVDEQWKNMLEETTPMVSVEYTTNSENADQWIRYNEAGDRVSKYNFKYDWNTKQNELTSADTFLYDEEGNHFHTTYYEGTNRGPAAIAQWDATYKNGLIQEERYQSYDFENLNWQKIHKYDEAGRIKSKEQYAPDLETGVLEMSTKYTYNSKGQLIKEVTVNTMFGSASTSTLNYSYDEAGQVIEEKKEGDGFTELLKFSYTDGRVSGIESFKAYEGQDMEAEEKATLTYEEGRLTELSVIGIKRPEYFYNLTLKYTEDHALPTREITEFWGSSRNFTFDQSFMYYWPK